MKSKPLLLFLVLVIAILFLFYVNNKKFKVQEGFNVTPVYSVVKSSGSDNTSTNGSYNSGLCRDNSGNIYSMGNSKVHKTNGKPPVTSVHLDTSSIPFSQTYMTGFAVDSTQTLYIATTYRIFKVVGTSINPYAGSTFTEGFVNNTNPLNAKFKYIVGIVFDNNNNMYVADNGNFCIRQIAANGGAVSIYAGGGTGAFPTPSPGTAGGGFSSARFQNITGMARDSVGDLYVTEYMVSGRTTGPIQIRKIIHSTRQVITIAAGMIFTKTLNAITIDSSNNIYVLSGNNTIYKLTLPPVAGSSYTATTFYSFAVGGASLATPLPRNIVIDSLGDLHVLCQINTNQNTAMYKLSLSCPAGAYLTGITCQLCAKGTWSLAGSTQCTACTPEGKTTPSTGSTAATECTHVSSTHYMNGTTLRLCPANATCAGGFSGTNTPTFTCIAGYKKNAANNGCEQCPIGFYGTNGTCSSACPTNRTTTSLGSTNVSQCVASKGFFVSPANLTSATAVGTTCPANTTTPSTGATSADGCSFVNAGYYMNGTTVTQCPANTSCPSGLKDTTTTFTCSNGYKTNALANACEECGVGFYGTGGTCSECPTNRTTISTRRTSSNDCIAAAGYFISGGTLQSCPTNTTSPSGSTSASQCTASNGYYMSGGIATPCPSNASCPGGTASFSCSNGYMKNAASNACEECGIGFYGTGGTCSGCPTNRTTATTKSTLLSQCIAAIGYYFSGTSTAAGTACPSNTTTSTTGSTTANDCSLVNAGYYMSNGTVTQCPANTSCPGGPRINTTTFTCADGYKKNALANGCEQCGVGFYGTGGTCSACPTNTTTSSTGSSNASQCTIAAAGYFMSGGTLQSCPANTTSPSGSTSASQCTASNGYYMSGGIAMPCPSNASCPGGIASFSCSNGYIKNATSNACEECGLGTWSSAGATSCTSCPLNTTTSLTARTSSNDCTSATAGHYMTATGPVECPAYARCAGGSSSFLCSNGYETNGSACISCGLGFYGTGGSCSNCTTLPATDSTASWTTTLIGQSSCTPLECKPNYKMNALSNNCDPCPQNTGGLNCTSASAGHYMNGSSVFACPSYASCRGGSDSFVCSNGYMKNPENTRCDQCPEGTEGLNCTTISSGFYMSGASVLSCPSNASCSGGSNPFICSNGYTINSSGDGCLQCPTGATGLNCRTALPGNYMSGTTVRPCPSNAYCEGGTSPYTCSNGYYVNSRNGTCDVVTVIVQPGNSQLNSTTERPTIADTTSCTATGCTLLFKDPSTGNMIPRNPCIQQGKIYNFRTKRCISKCCVMSMSNAKNDNQCKNDVNSGPPVKNATLCRTRPHPCCGIQNANNTSCSAYWSRGAYSWSAQNIRECEPRPVSGFTDYGIDSISEKRRKYLIMA